MTCLESNHLFLSEWHSLVSRFIPHEHKLLHKFVEGGLLIACAVGCKGNEVIFHAKAYKGAFLDVPLAESVGERFNRAIDLQNGLNKALGGLRKK